jgi:hypothetical protein
MGILKKDLACLLLYACTVARCKPRPPHLTGPTTTSILAVLFGFQCGFEQDMEQDHNAPGL